MNTTLESLEIHLIAGLRITVEHMLMATIDWHFHRQTYRRETTLNITHPVFNTKSINAAIAVFTPTCCAGSQWGDKRTIVKAKGLIATLNDHRFKQMWISFLINRFHFALPPFSNLSNQRIKPASKPVSIACCIFDAFLQSPILITSKETCLKLSRSSDNGSVPTQTITVSASRKLSPPSLWI